MYITEPENFSSEDIKQHILDSFQIYYKETIFLTDDLIGDLFFDDLDLEEMCIRIGDDFNIDFISKNPSILDFNTVSDLINWFNYYI